MNKLILMIDESTSYLDKKVKEKYLEWGYVQSDMTYTTEWKNGIANKQSFFGQNFVHLDLSDKKDLKAFVELIDNRKKNNLFKDNDWYYDGVIITTTHQQGSSKVVKLVKEFSGDVLEKRKADVVKKELLQELKINKELTGLISDYVGDDYELLLGVINNMKSVTKEEKDNLTFETIYSFLPSKPGSIPPWNFLNEVFNQNINNAVYMLKRTLENTHYLVIITLLKSKMNLLYQYTLLSTLGYKTNNEKAKALQLKNSYVFIDFQKIKKLDLSVAEYLCKLIVKAEEDLKGNLNLYNYDAYIESLVTKIIIALSTNKILEKL